eukprot:COSAG02_NODE_50634_length_319_cov_0.927273_1_plen_22_part_10
MGGADGRRMAWVRQRRVSELLV